MAYETGTFATPKALFDNIVAKVQSTAFMGAGNEWQLVYSYDGWGDADAGQNRVVKTFLVPGPSGAGDFHVVLGITPSTGTNTTNYFFGALQSDPLPPWGGATWITRGAWSNASVSYARGDVVKYGGFYYVCEVAHTSTGSNPSSGAMAGIWYSIGTGFSIAGAVISTTNYHTVYYSKVWNGGTGDIKYWLFANAQRVMFVTKSDNRYHFAYAGGYVRFAAASAHPLPTLLAGNNTDDGDTYLDTGNRNFPASGHSLLTAISLKGPGNRTATDNEVYAFPPGGYVAPQAPVGRNPAGDYPVMPVILGFHDSSFSNDIGVVGTMDGVAITDTRDNASENVITVGGDDWLCIEDVYRGQAGHFLALKMA